MKATSNPQLLRRFAAAVGGFALFTGTLSAAPFLYSSGDLVLAFRQSGNATDYAVNLGKATNYNSVPAGTTFTVTNLSLAQLNSSFPSLNELQWSVAAANRALGQDLNYPVQTIWVTRPRTAPGTVSIPWQRKSQFVQGNVASQIDAIGANAATASSTLPGGANNTALGVVIPVNNNPNLSSPIGTSGNYAGNFQGNVETLTAVDFDGSANNVSRADLYELLPGSGNPPGRYLGYFELKPNGTLTFNNLAVAPAAPTITNVTRTGNVTTVSFTSVAGVTYRLRTTNAAGLNTPVASWTVGNSVVGTGAVLSLTDTSADDVRYFAVDAQ